MASGARWRTIAPFRVELPGSASMRAYGAARSAADLARHTYPGAALPERFLAMPRNFLQIRLLKP